jgi:hypothetical protein
MFGDIYYFRDEFLHKQYPHGLYVRDNKILLDPYVKKKVLFNNRLPIDKCTYEELRILLVLAANLAAYKKTFLPKNNVWIHPNESNELILVPIIIAAISKYKGVLPREIARLIDNRHYGVRGYVKDDEPIFIKNPTQAKSRIEDIEILINNELPDNYKRFLMDTNGGRPQVPLINKQFEFLIDSHFLDIDSTISLYKTIEQNISGVLPIAIVHGGIICISFKNERYGHILYIRNEDYSNIYKALNIPKVGIIANNFYEFLINLNEIPEGILQLAKELIESESVVCE